MYSFFDLVYHGKPAKYKFYLFSDTSMMKFEKKIICIIHARETVPFIQYQSMFV